jgi:uncharacterized protein (DUF433 family)/DNA-binding transcriptional MerR regulator
VNEAQQNADELARGVYLLPHLARLTELNAPRVRRWLEGYQYKSRAGDKRRSDPLFRRERRDGERIFTFIDLVEVLFVKTFLDQGVSMRTIRLVQREAAEEFEVRHPFCVKKFETDGETIFERFSRDGREHLLDRKRRQFVNVTIFNPLIKKLDYDRVSREAMRWWPMGKDTPIVVDPKHAFGAPSVASAAVTTATLFASVRANKSAENVADWFGVTIDEVRAAVRFEQSRTRGAKSA